ncbi:hypothetical protein PC121_g6578 [Phytophthora cactorum]|nr:hypothetical protein PC121_g6578 [Phytophthora cactorum]
MLDMKKDDFTQRPPPDDEGESIPRSLPADHVLRENPDYQIVNGQRKRRQRQCKVCSNESAASESVELPSTIAQDVVFRTKQEARSWQRCGKAQAAPAITECQNNDNAAEATEREDTAEEEAAEDTAADEHATEDAAADQHADEE